MLNLTPHVNKFCVLSTHSAGPPRSAQHLALKTEDIITTLREMRARSAFGGFEFMPRPSDSYYRKLPSR